MVIMGKKYEPFWAMVGVTVLYTSYMVYLNLVYSPTRVALIVEIPIFLVLLLYLTMLGRTFVISNDSITVITMYCFKRVYTWRQSPRIYICTLKEKACSYKKYFILPLSFKHQMLSRPMMYWGWYKRHMNQAACYPYSYQMEQELLKNCPNVELVRVYNDFDQYD